MSLDKIIKHAYSIIGRGEKLRNEQIDDAINALDIMFASWANKGADLWRTEKVNFEIPKPLIVENGGEQYICIRKHTASSFNEPGAGANSEIYWVSTSGHLTVEAWVAGVEYLAANDISLIENNIFSIGTARIIDAGEILEVSFIPRRKFEDLDPAETSEGSSTRYRAVFEPTRAGQAPRIILYPTPDKEGLVLEFHKIFYVDSTMFYEGIPANWLAAIQYGLAVELGYMNGIALDVLTSVVNKFKFEFQRARGSEREVISSCFVEPLF